MVGVYFDHLKRLHFTIPRQGPLFLYCRADLFYQATIGSHIQDLSSHIGEKKALLLLNDRGPDWDWTKMINLIALFHLWKKKRLVIIVLVAYAAYNRYLELLLLFLLLSAFNIIEHDWSHVSAWFAG